MELSSRLFTVYEEMLEGTIDAGWQTKQVSTALYPSSLCSASEWSHDTGRSRLGLLVCDVMGMGRDGM